MKKRIAIIGYGNIGRFSIDAVNASPDFELAGVVRRGGAALDACHSDIRAAASVRELGPVDAALLCTPTRKVEETAKELLSLGINTVDSFDIHGSILALRNALDGAARASGAVAIVSSGWDPGSDSVIRALMEACAPRGITYTNFGNGMSMGHTVAAKSVHGVRKALSMTIPRGAGIHRRMVYVELEDGAVFAEVEASIKADPYFSHDDTRVTQVSDVDSLIDMGSGVNMVRKGVSGITQNQRFEFNMTINNPALTSQIMVACARASFLRPPGAYTMIELPVIDLLPGDRNKNIDRLV